MTAFVGKNESGKSALFRGLSKINPSDGKQYDGLKEFPRKKYTEFEQKDWPVCSVTFGLDDNDVNKLAEIHSELKSVSEVVVTVYYSNKHTVEFTQCASNTSCCSEQYCGFLEWCKTTIGTFAESEGQSEKLDEIKATLNKILDSTIHKMKRVDISDPLSVDTIQYISTHLDSQLNEKWKKEQFADIIQKNNAFLEKAQIADKIEVAKTWILDNMPQYIYFDRYDMLDSAVNINDFKTKIVSDPENAKLRITKCLFQHVGLNIEKIIELDPSSKEKTDIELTRMADERRIAMSSASRDMTQKFYDWWVQKKYFFNYTIDGGYFRVWVYDDRDPSEVELDQRSAGLQYFFSFYLVFLVEAHESHANSILLLDEPGLHYHGTAQKKTVEFLQKISQDNQLLYTTHSPFMIDGDKLQDVRIVSEDEKGHTLVSSDVWPKDRDSLFPLQAGLGYSLAQTLFFAKRNLVVEGITDYLILKSMSNLLAKKKMKALDDNVVVVPAGGATHIMPLASMLRGNEQKLIVLLDGDDSGSRLAKHLEKKLFVNCVLVSTFADKDCAEIEDLFPEEFYLKACKEVYPNAHFQFNESERNSFRIVTRIKKMFERLDLGVFEKWKVALVFVDWIQTGCGENEIPEDACKKFSEIFDVVNASLSDKDHT